MKKPTRKKPLRFPYGERFKSKEWIAGIKEDITATINHALEAIRKENKDWFRLQVWPLVKGGLEVSFHDSKTAEEWCQITLSELVTNMLDAFGKEPDEESAKILDEVAEGMEKQARRIRKHAVRKRGGKSEHL